MLMPCDAPVVWGSGPLRFLAFFMDNPYGEVYLREAAKRMGLSPFAVKKYAEMLLRDGLIVEDRRANLRYFKANADSQSLRHLKIARSLDAVKRGGLVEGIVDAVPNVSAIVLFGSVARGTDDLGSDLDLLIIGSKGRVDWEQYEGRLGREVNAHFFTWDEWKRKAAEDAPFYREVVRYGIPLHGEMPETP